eukprot:TRINITY_DN7578_c2_g1_i1.p1 TRINITY_DN7578_c2_g1~~TRINITY_DN7578_c2_g1_i1.p1  ORF type:complete len:102 (-),score=8.20 TRINITY_DN7578_c2_g1_i1:214-519(-)
MDNQNKVNKRVKEVAQTGELSSCSRLPIGCQDLGPYAVGRPIQTALCPVRACSAAWKELRPGLAPQLYILIDRATLQSVQTFSRWLVICSNMQLGRCRNKK